MRNLHAEEPFRDQLRSYFVSSLLNNLSSHAGIAKGRACLELRCQQAAKGPAPLKAPAAKIRMLASLQKA